MTRESSKHIINKYLAKVGKDGVSKRAARNCFRWCYMKERRNYLSFIALNVMPKFVLTTWERMTNEIAGMNMWLPME